MVQKHMVWLNFSAPTKSRICEQLQREFLFLGEKSGAHVGEGKPGLQVAWKVYIASATRCLSCMGKLFHSHCIIFSTYLGSLFATKQAAAHPIPFSCKAFKNAPCWLGETEVPALAGKAKQCFHFRSWVRPSCRTIASNFFLRRLEVLIISTCSLESPAMFLQDGMGGSGMSTRRFRVWRLDAIQCRHSLRLTPLNARAHCKTFNPDTQFDEFVRKHILQCQPLLPKVLCLSGLLNRRVIVEKKCS